MVGGLRRILRDRQLRDRHRTNNDDEQCDHPREDRPINKNLAMNRYLYCFALGASVFPSACFPHPRKLRRGFAWPARRLRLHCLRPRHGLHRCVAAQLLETVDHHLFAGLQAAQHDPLIVAWRRRP